MNTPMLTSIAFSLAVLLMPWQHGKAEPISTTYSEDRTSFTLFIENSLGISRDEVHVLEGGSDWRLNIEIRERVLPLGSVAPGDNIGVRITARHINAPHDEPANPEDYFVAEFVFADSLINPPPGSYTRMFPPRRREHPPLGHFDEFESRVDYVTALGPSGQGPDITRYFVVIRGRHAEENDAPPAPEPSTFILFGIGTLSLVCHSWRRKRVR